MAVKDKYKFTVSFQGSALEDHSIDVRKLAPAMLSLGSLFEDANNLLNDDRATAKLKAVATKSGSFEISFILDQTLIQATKDFFNSNLVVGELIAGYLFFDIDARISLATLLKFLQGKKPDRIEEKGESVQIIQGNNSLVVYKPVFNLYNNGNIRNEIQRLVKPLDDEGIDSMKIFENEEKKQIITKEEKDYFSSVEIDEEVLTDNDVELLLKIVTISPPQNHKWRLDDGEKVQFYSLKDEDFIKNIERGKKFTLNDMFRCQVRIIQKRNKSTNKIKFEREIIKVLKHLEFTEEQKELFDQ